MRALVGVVLLVTACSGRIDGGAGDPDGGGGTVTLAFVAPAAGAGFTRSTHSSATGALVADVPVTIAVTGDVARVAITDGPAALGDADGHGALDAEVAAAGAQTLTATAYDAGGAALATATVDITVADPDVADCHGRLDLYGVSYTVGPTSPGVADPVTLTPPINGIPFRYLGNTSPRATFFMDCQLARSLAEAAVVMRAHDVTMMDDLGVYNYRCINNDGTPPNCTIGMSEHAYALAIDLAQFTTSDGTTYNVKDDFVINADGKTCTDATQPGKDTWLHQIICEMKGDHFWNIVLTPNYNDLHRDHFHVDLTPGADFIRARLPTRGPWIDE